MGRDLKRAKWNRMGERLLPRKGLREVQPTTTNKITHPPRTKANTV